jgi:YrbI family 3-deoxy-D-manno-octulosonate 8-phosphate phosphatase
MAVIAVIPARGGSKGVPGKNLRPVGGVPLVVRAVLAARAVPGIDRIAVSTDDTAIARAALAAGAEVVDRPDDLSGDTASSESALIHALDTLAETGEPCDVLVFLQATSPFIDTEALADAVQRVTSGQDDVVFSAAESHVFLWRTGDGGAEGVNHDKAVRPRRQDREPQFAETGAFYVMRADGFRAAGHRFFGRVGIAVVDPRGALEIDTVEELQLASAIADLLDEAPRRTTGERVAAALLPIDADAVVTDFDGVQTDDRVILSDHGDEYVLANRSDGAGVRMLRDAGVPLLILSTEVHRVSAARSHSLPVDLVHGSDDKAAALQWWATEHGVDLGRVAYLGVGPEDLACLELVGWPVSAADAGPEVRAAARIVLDHPAGHGAVRELAERVLRGRPADDHDRSAAAAALATQQDAAPIREATSIRKEERHDRAHRLAARR